MRSIHFVVLCALATALSGIAALADTIEIQELRGGQQVIRLVPGATPDGELHDPRIVVRRLKTGSVPLSGFQFGFDSDGGTGVFDFFNGLNAGILNLTLTITPGGPDSSVLALFLCGVDTQLQQLPFSNCSFAQTGDQGSSTIVTFSGPPGLPPQSHFAVDITGFPPLAHIDATAQPAAVPELGSIGLFLSGLGALAIRWKWRLRSRGSSPISG